MDDSEIDVSLMNSGNFDEDSMCTFHEEYNEEKTFNWRGWRNPNNNNFDKQPTLQSQAIESMNRKRANQTILPLVELAAKTVACHIPFEVVENVNPPVPEQLHLRITYWAFPESEDEIRLYACLANGNSSEYDKAESIMRNFGVKNLLQIGFYISATVLHHENNSIKVYDVSLTFDRRRIVKCTCTCPSTSVMCCHIVAVCLNRIFYSKQTALRPPVSESLLKLDRNQLQKFAQYLITKKDSPINTVHGAPDPTSGPSVFDKHNWCLDLGPLHEGIRKTLVKLTVVSPEITSDVEYLNSTPPHYTVEFSSFLKPLRGKDPEAMWNLISIVKNLMKKCDENSVTILKVMTEEIVDCDHVICWWFTTKTRMKNNGNYNNFLNINNNLNNNNNRGHIQNFSAQSMQASSYMCDEIVHLWRLTVLNPKLSLKEKQEFYEMIKSWHFKIMKTIFEQHRDDDTIINDLDKHPGFKSALKACLMNWDDYPIPGITTSSTKTTMNSIDNKTSKNNNSDEEDKICDLVDSNLKLTNQNGDEKPAASSTSSNEENNVNSIPNEGDNQPSSSQQEQEQQQASLEEEIKPSVSGQQQQQQRSIDDELNFLYKYKITINNDLNCKYPHVNQQQQFTYTLSVKKDENPFEVKLARAEILYAHGLDKYASDLVIDLANNILENPPRIDVELNHQPNQQQNTQQQNTQQLNTQQLNTPPQQSNVQQSQTQQQQTATNSNNNKDGTVKVKKTKSKNQLINANLQASEIYTKIIFLCNVLINNNIRLDLAFKVGLLGLELAKPPAIIKALEVKLYYQEQELLFLLKKIPLDKPEMDLLREKGRQIRDGKLTRGSLLPLTLANLIFDALVLSKTDPQKTSPIVKHQVPVDDYIGFECAVTTIGLKCPFTEKDHYVLWESIRRQRFEFIINTLVYYKNKENRLVRIIEKLIDKESNAHFCDLDKKGSSSTFLKNKVFQKPIANGSTINGTSITTTISTIINNTIPSSANQQQSTYQKMTTEEELIEYEKKYSKCNCTLKDLNSKIISASSPNYSYTYNLIQSSKSRTKDKTKQIQTNGKSVAQINFQFMLDLAKNLLTKAGGNLTEEFDGRNITNIVLIKPHKQLHICSFLIGLYALGLSNQFTKWLQRTFSSHVSWIQDQAKEIGAPAINCLITAWKGYLTPSETAVIVCTGFTQSPPPDSTVLKALAKLALSTLSESQALSFFDIQHAIRLCRDTSEDMLIQALISIESSFKNGGLSSDILFEAAKNWYELHTDYSLKESKDFNKLSANGKRKMMQNQVASSIAYSPYSNVVDYASLNGFNNGLNNANAANQVNRLHSQLMLSMPPPPLPPHFNAYNCPPPPLYYPGLIYPNQHPINAATLPLTPAHFNGNFNLPPPLGNYNLHMVPPPPPAAMFKNYPPPISNLAQPPIQHQQFNNAKQQQQNYLMQFSQQRFVNGSRSMFNHCNTLNGKQMNNQPPLLPLLLHHPNANQPMHSLNPYQTTPIQQQQAKCESYLFRAYSLGIMALDALPKKSSDDRSAAAKFDLNPQYYEEIIWLAKISFKLTPVQHQEFLSHVINSVSSPFILYDLVMTIEENISTLYLNHPTKNLFKQLINNAQHAFEQCLRYKISHLTPTEYEEYVRIVMKAKQIYLRSSHGLDAFQKKLDTIKNGCKDIEKENLLESINAMLKNNDFIINEPNHTSSIGQHQSPT